MRVWELKSPGLEHLNIGQRPEPHPSAGEVVVRIRAASLNYRDLAIALGKYPAVRTWPVIPFSDGAGEVVETGAGVTSWRAGDRVVGNFFTGWTDGPLTPSKAATALGGASVP